MRDAIRYALVASALVHVAVQATRAWRTGRWGGRHAGWIWGEGHPAGSPSLTGSYLAICLPLAPWWVWPPLLVGLYWASSGLSLVALTLALPLWMPVWGPWMALGALILGGAAVLLLVCQRSPVLAGRRLGEWTPRGDSLDPLVLRLRTWRLVAGALCDRRIWPWGRRPLGWDLRRHMTATGEVVMAEHAFNEYLEVVYEYGIVGLVGVFGGLGALGWSLCSGDPFSVAMLVWALTMMGSITLRTWPFPALGALVTLGVLT